MTNYREIYNGAIEQLDKTYGPPAYAATRKNYLELFEELATADIRLFEDDRPDPDDPYYPVNDEILAELAEEIEILHRVGYQFADEWEDGYLKLKSKLAAH